MARTLSPLVPAALCGVLALAAASAWAAPPSCLELSAGPVLVTPPHPYARDQASLVWSGDGWVGAWRIDAPSPTVAVRTLAPDLSVRDPEERMSVQGTAVDGVALGVVDGVAWAVWADGATAQMRRLALGKPVQDPPGQIGHAGDDRPVIGPRVVPGKDGSLVVSGLRGTAPGLGWSVWRVAPTSQTRVDVDAVEGATVGVRGDVAVDADGRPWLAWVDGPEGGPGTLHVVGIGAEEPGAVVDVATGVSWIAPALASGPEGLVVVWADASGVRAQRLDAKGKPAGEALEVAAGAARDVALALVGGRPVVGWSAADIGLRVVDWDAPDTCVAVTAHRPDARVQDAPIVAAGADGSGVVAWQSDVPLETVGLWGRTFRVAR